jgi:hypothetical protein
MANLSIGQLAKAGGVGVETFTVTRVGDTSLRNWTESLEPGLHIRSHSEQGLDDRCLDVDHASHWPT